MAAFSTLLDRHPLVFAHVVLAAAALALGAWLLWRRKGTPAHRSFGWVWVGLMGGAALSSAFIRDYGLPNLAGFTPIHVFTVLVLVQLPRGVWFIRHGDVARHQRAMRSLYRGGCLLAGLFTLLPGRFLGSLLWKQVLGLAV